MLSGNATPGIRTIALSPTTIQILDGVMQPLVVFDFVQPVVYGRMCGHNQHHIDTWLYGTPSAQHLYHFLLMT